jgi:hypothetical protein
MRIRNPAYMYRSCYDTRFCQRMLNDLGHKIKRSKERLLLTQMEQAAANGRLTNFYLVVSVISRFAEPYHFNPDPDSAPPTFFATSAAIFSSPPLSPPLGKVIPATSGLQTLWAPF